MSTAPTAPAEQATENEISFNLNGQNVSARNVDADATLLDVLREEFDVVSPKNGCQPMGQCGCCTVMVDGKATLSCVISAAKTQGKTVTTLEGLDPKLRETISSCFVSAGGLQCGFCIPGIALRTKAILDKNASPTREEIERGLVAHLCRCTGYKKIVDSIDLTARTLRGEAEPLFDYSGRVGTSLPRYSGMDAVLGDRHFIDDIKLTGMVYGAPVFSAHPRAVITSLDVQPALDMPRVLDVITAEHVPGQRHQGLIYKDWPQLVAVGEVTHCVGDIIAVVVAETQRAARKAAKLVRVSYNVLEPVTDPEAALTPDAAIVHPDTHPGSNLLSKSAIKRGEDVEPIFEKCAHIVEDTFQTQRIEHAFLEPEACIAFPVGAGERSKSNGNGNGNGQTVEVDSWAASLSKTAPAAKIHILTQGQGVFDDQRQIASVLGMNQDEVAVTLVSNGGAFGGKEDLSIQAHAALIAQKLGRPAKITLTRDESMRLHPKRHAIKMHYKVGCDAEGKILAVHGRMIGDKGAYASVGTKVLERAGGHATGPYVIPNLDIEALAVYTNNPPCGAMRGFGANQAAFAIEGCLDRLAEKVGIDGWDIRWRNAMDTGDVFCSGQVLDKPVGLKKTLLAVKDYYRSEKHAGIACGIKNVGIGNGMPDAGQAVIRVDVGRAGFQPAAILPAANEADDDYTITIFNGFTEMGQGLLTILIQSAVEIIPSLDPRKFRVTIDTSRATPCGMTTASRGTVLGCMAVKRAAEAMKVELDSGKTVKDLAGREFFGEITYDYTVPLGKLEGKNGGPVKTHVTFGFATQVVALNEDGTLKKVVAAHDVGKVMNPILLEGQMEGSIHMGLGYALTEDFACEGGFPKAKKLNDLGILRAHHMPEVECIFIEEADPETPWGAKGVGEIGLVPTAGAVAGALHAHDGQWRTALPMRDSAAAKKILGISTKGTQPPAR
ncbi:MAG: molybdopterin cofactor-binding domain-containing protein [Candidatus Sumerlaeaceae bacterium]